MLFKVKKTLKNESTLLILTRYIVFKLGGFSPTYNIFIIYFDITIYFYSLEQ